MSRFAWIIGSGVLGMLVWGCGHRTPSVVDAAYLSGYISDPENGLLRSHTVLGITTTVKLLPPQVTALRELASAKQDTCFEGWPALLDRNDDMLCFVINLGTDGKARKGDVMYANARDPEQFKEQAFDLNFDWEQQLELRCGNSVYAPVLSTLENTYSLTSDRNVLVVFVPGTKEDPDFYRSNDIELTWRDATMGTGIQRFRFSREELKAVPQPTV